MSRESPAVGRSLSDWSNEHAFTPAKGESFTRTQGGGDEGSNPGLLNTSKCICCG